MTTKHPANSGLVLMSAWVDPALRDYARASAKDLGVPFSRFVSEAVREALARGLVRNRPQKMQDDAFDSEGVAVHTAMMLRDMQPSTLCTCITAHDRAVCVGWCKR